MKQKSPINRSVSAGVMALVAERDLAQRSKDEREGIVSALRVRLRECEGEVRQKSPVTVKSALLLFSKRALLTSSKEPY